MNPVAAAEQAIRDADPDSALKFLQDGVRANPADAKLRIFLFQLLSVQGQWDRALNQLNVAAELDASSLAMAQMYREALRCEALRADVFAGRRSPLIFGMPEQWLALLIESLLNRGQGNTAQAASLRERAFEEAPATSGTIDEQPFAWIADADMRLGPVCEAVINGKYYFVPFSALTRLSIEAPEDLRDLVWMPAHFEFTNGGEAVGVIPTRYPGSESSGDSLIRLARKTEWTEVGDGSYHGSGQRVLTTDAGDLPLMGIREIRFNAAPVAG
ncbi:type VI secretion system accessory protein TagJ [Niveibacterium sp. 24ML]|uniref:type VI secretion system accessory protein TagJ n=1 Tax=Niveibacterium sp. 24ML TaxID=2985512 RepID=UPI00226DA50B|nr:type VI secretion system accessory protein TagJ [Niveibacterium sp. 24ML]MCX9156617.1 type VI secretion system accessory protein TagJ [Niveibacterium sp. 24ML]